MPCKASSGLLNVSRSTFSNYLHTRQIQIHPSSARKTNYSPLRSPPTFKLSYPNKRPRRASDAVVIPGLSALPYSQPQYPSAVNPFPMAVPSIEHEQEMEYSPAAPSYNAVQYGGAPPRGTSSVSRFAPYGDNATNYGAPYRGPQSDPYYNSPARYTPSNPPPSDQTYYMRQTPASPHGAAYGAYNPPQWTPSNTNSYQSPSQQPRMPPMNPQLLMGSAPAPFPLMPFPPMPSIPGVRPMSSFAGPPIEPSQLLQPPAEPGRQRSITPPMTVPSASAEYLKQAQGKPEKTKKRPLLVILDLNGTLIYRKRRKFPPSFVERPGLREFLDELCNKYSVMVWTSSKPETCEAIVSSLFPTTGKKKKQKLVACWGRDKFDLTKRQYNAKLQVYKELQKVWNTPEIQREYPSKLAKAAAAQAKPKNGKGGKFAANKQKEVKVEYPEGHRWDQTNTVLIDDSKIKALSEPYNILEIPEFTNDPEIDESTLFRRVLVTLYALSSHDDVSKVFRVWEERQAQQNCKILDLDISPELPPAFAEDLDSSDDGGIKLPQDESSQTQSQTSVKNAKVKAMEKKARKKQKGKERKQARKAELAAEKAAQEGSSGAPLVPGVPSESVPTPTPLPTPVSAPSPATAPAPTSAPAPAPVPAPAAPAAKPTPKEANPQTKKTPEERAATRKAAKQRKKARKAEKQQSEAEKQRSEAMIKELGADASNNVIQETPGPRYNFRSKVPKPSEPSVPGVDASASVIPSTDDEHWSAVHSAVEQSPVIPVERRRSISPATSDGSRNSLLDRLEEGLGFKK